MNIVAELKRIATELNDEEYYGYLIHSLMTSLYLSYISKNKDLALKTANEAIQAIENPDIDSLSDFLNELGEREGVTLVCDEDETLEFDNGTWFAYPKGYLGEKVKVKMLGKYSQRF